MNLIQFNNVFKQFNGEYILENINFKINKGDKIGLIGLNGVGKTTLLKIILKEENFEKGQIYRNPNISIGYLSQNMNFINENNDVYNELLSSFEKEKQIIEKIAKNNEENLEEYLNLVQEYENNSAYDIEYMIKNIMQGLQLKELKGSIKNLSGGEKSRILLAKLILKNPDLLILDEPTNHLDIISIEWLEDFLKKYNKTYIIISHDRVFLDNVTNKIMEIENKNLEEYKGNFSSFLIQKEMILKGKITKYEKETKKIKEMEEFIQKYKAGIKSKMARGRQKILDRLENPSNPIFNPNKMKLKFQIEKNSSTRIMEAINISKSFNNKKILNNVSFEVYKGDKIGIIGKNGTGKSTLLKILISKLKADEGKINIRDNINIGYYDQNQNNLNYDNTVFDEINTNINYTEEYLKSKLSSFLFYEKDIFKKVSLLSGGEKSRLTLLKLSQEKNNFLILDEPTNHLDIYSLEVLEDALIDFEGTLILISHNRHFINSVCNKIFLLSNENLTEFKGNYEEYKESIKNVKEIKDKSNKKDSYLKRKEEQKNEIKRKKDIEKIENQINEISLLIENLNKKMQELGFTNDLEAMMNIQKQIEENTIKENDLFKQLEILLQD